MVQTSGCWCEASEERVEHARFQTLGARNVPAGEPHQPVQVGAGPQAGEGEPAGGGAAVPMEGPEGGGAALEDLDADDVLTRRPLGDAHQGDGGGEAAALRGDAVEDRLPRPHRGAPLPHHARLLGHGHAAEVAQGLQVHLLQPLLVGETQQDGDEARNGAAPQQQLLQLSWERRELVVWSEEISAGMTHFGGWVCWS